MLPPINSPRPPRAFASPHQLRNLTHAEVLEVLPAFIIAKDAERRAALLRVKMLVRSEVKAVELKGK